MQDKIDILKQAAEEKTKAYEAVHYEVRRNFEALSDHRKRIGTQGLERAALAAEAEIKKLERKVQDAEAEVARQNNRVNQDRADYYRSLLAKAKKQLDSASAKTELVEARKHEAELMTEGERLRDESHLSKVAKQNADTLLASVSSWLDKAGELEPVKVTIPKDASLESVRADIAKLQAEMAEVDSARLDNDSLKKQARAYVAQAAESAAPVLSGLDGELVIDCEDVDAFGFMAWAYPDPLIKRLEAKIDALPGKGLSVKEKQAKRVELEAKTLEAEYLEEALILRDGGNRRPDANPMAVLQLKPKEPAKAA